MSDSRQKRKKLTLTLKDKHEIIKRIDEGENYKQISKAFGIGRSTIYDICKNRASIEKAAKLPHKSDRRTLRAEDYPELEEKLHQWYLAERHLYPITGSLVMVKARTIHKEMTGKDDFLASTGWLDRFKKRRGIVLGSVNVSKETMDWKKEPAYKCCVVPTCKNTTTSAPGKVYFLVPKDADTRKQWLKVIGRDGDVLSSKSSLYCCEDHFDVEDDTQNYMQYKIMAVEEGKKTSLRLKKGIVPHKFKGQQIKGQQEKHQQRIAIVCDCVKREPPESVEENSSASSSKPAESPSPPPEQPVTNAPIEQPDIRVERTAGPSGDQLVIRVTDKLDSKTNVFNRFTINDGHFENNITVKEEVEERFIQEEQQEAMEEGDPDDPDDPDDPHDTSEEMFPQPEAILGDTDNDNILEEKNTVLRELNETLRKFLTEYKTRNALMRERIDIERARLQFDMEVYRNRQVEKRASENAQ